MSLRYMFPVIGMVIAVMYRRRRIAGISLLLAGGVLSLALELGTGLTTAVAEGISMILHTLQFVLGYLCARAVIDLIHGRMDGKKKQKLPVLFLLLGILMLLLVPVGSRVTYKVKEDDRVITINYDHASKIWRYLRRRLGCSRAAAAGVLGNMFAESEYNPDIIESNDVGHGIGQWSWDRWYGEDGLEQYALSKGKDWSDLQLQLSFLRHEVVENDSMGAYYDGGFVKYRKLRKVDGEEGTAKIFFSAFEYGNYVSYEDFISDDFEALYATRSKRLTVAKLIWRDKKRFP